MLSAKQLANSYVTVDFGKFKRNLQRVQSYLNSGTELMFTAKSNGYGHGLTEMALYAAEHCGIQKISTAMLLEAMELRQAGYAGFLMVLGGIPPAALPAVVEYDLVTACYNADLAIRLNELAGSAGKMLDIHLKIDSGMHRLGVTPGDELQQLLDVLKKLPHLHIDGCFTHLANADEADQIVSNRQLDLFDQAIVQLHANGIEPRWLHTAGSDAVITCRRSHYNLVRPAAILYGYDTAEGPFNRLSVEPVLSWHSVVTNIRIVKAGEAAGYSAFYQPKQETLLAIVGFGASDGYLRSLVSKDPTQNGYVLIRGQKAPVVAICMDQSFIDISQIPNVKIGDPVTILGTDDALSVTAYDLKSLSHTTIGYVLASISSRPPRIYVNSLTLI